MSHNQAAVADIVTAATGCRKTHTQFCPLAFASYNAPSTACTIAAPPSNSQLGRSVAAPTLTVTTPSGVQCGNRSAAPGGFPQSGHAG